MKKLIGSVAVAFLMVGCGGTEADPGLNGETPSEVSLERVEQGLCEGFSSGARWCTTKCGNNWYYVGTYPGIGSGQCTEAGDQYCRYWYGVGSTGACWSF